MDLQNLCMGCMEGKDIAGKCSKCDYIEPTAPEPSYYLQPRTVLQEKYLIGRVLGQGGFAITYLSWDINLGIKLAIKEYFPLDLVYRIPGNNLVIAHSQAQETIFAHDMEKFLQEARSLARFMDHPNIVSVTDFFQANRTAYLVMHYIEGVTLRYHLKKSGEKLPFKLTMEIMMPVMDALRVIHDAGLLHRDISPENIVISRNGRVMLIDFGAVRSSKTGKDDSVSVVMKPGYTPEEQFRSRGVQGPPTDIYSTAATIYRTITGQMPPDSLDRLDEDNLVHPSELGVDINPEQEKALLKAMAVSSKDRYKSIADFQKALLQKKSNEKVDNKTQQKKQQQEDKKPEEIVDKPVKKEKDAESGAVLERQLGNSYTSLGDVGIGRAETNEIVLEDNTASRFHARIFSRMGKWYIADLDSTHGTYVNDERIKEHIELTAPSRIRVSGIILYYDGKAIIDKSGKVLYKLSEHVSFTERWLRGDKLSANRIIENFLASLNQLVLIRRQQKSLLTVNIGRATINDLILENDMVSRYHARIFHYDGNWYLADLHSTHGTKVNGKLVKEPIALKNSDKISISDIELIFNGKSIFSDDGNLSYDLPESSDYAVFNPKGIISIMRNIIQFLKDDNNWLIAVVIFCLLIIIILIIILLVL